MSRKTLLLCVVAIACFVTTEALFSGPIDHAKKILTDIIDAAIADFQHALFKIKERALEDMEDLRQRALEITEDIYKSVSDMLDDAIKRIDQRIDDLTNEAKGVDVSECKAMRDELQNTALSIIANSSACVTDKIEEGTGYLETIALIGDEVLSNLTVIGNEATECVKEIGLFGGTVKALACLTVATKDAMVTSTKRIPAVLLEIGKISALVGTIVPSLSYCSTKKSAFIFIDQANDITTKVEACVEEKMHEFLGRTSPTTEKVTLPHTLPPTKTPDTIPTALPGKTQPTPTLPTTEKTTLPSTLPPTEAPVTTPTTFPEETQPPPTSPTTQETILPSTFTPTEAPTTTPTALPEQTQPSSTSAEKILSSEVKEPNVDA